MVPWLVMLGVYSTVGSDVGCIDGTVGSSVVSMVGVQDTEGSDVGKVGVDGTVGSVVGMG